MKKIIILLCAVLLLCTACGVKKDETVPDNVPTESDSEEISVMEENSPFGTYSDSRKDIDKDVETVIKDRITWIYWLYFNFEYESGSNNYGDFQNAIEHEYYYRNGKELNDFGIDNYALLFNEYYGVDINTAREYLKYSENYNSEDNTLTPVYDWREENYSGDADILYMEQEGDIFTAYVLIKYSEDYMTQYSYTYTFDENGYFKMLDSSGNIYSLCYCEDSAEYEIAIYKENNNFIVKKFKDNALIDSFENDIKIPGMLLLGFETRYELKDNILKIYCEDYPTVVYADLVEKKFTVDIDTKALLRNGEYTESKNNTSLIMTGCYGGGDISFSDVYFVDDNLKAYYLEATGGMYGGNADFGFFMNGDVYFFGNTYFHIYEKGILSYKLEDHFRLGEIDDGYRFILAVKRNTNRTFTVLYGCEKDNFKQNDNYLNSTYQLAVIDYDGNIIKNIDTGIQVYYSPFGLGIVSMRESDGLVSFEVKYHKGTVVGKYEVNLNTGEIKIINETQLE